ncbi:MAG: PRC-barrel domain-containing protein [Rubrivivax sp.]
MNHRHSELVGRQLLTLDDDEVGEITDLYFDDERWTVRYLVVDTGGWLDSRKVLISPASLTQVPPGTGGIRAQLSREQVRNSPPVETHAPVSRQQEATHAAYYGYPMYWAGSGLWGMGALPAADPLTEARQAAVLTGLEADFSKGSKGGADSHLRSAAEVTGYHIQAEDGEIGHVEDFLIDADSWRIRALLVGTRNWLPGKHVQVDPGVIRQVDWVEQVVAVGMTREAIRQAPPSDN